MPAARRTSSPATPATPAAPAAKAEAAWLAVVESYADHEGVTLPSLERRRFGSNGLRIDGKVFAMRVGEDFVVKLPAPEVDAAIAEGRGERLMMGKGRVMKEWLVVREPPARWKKIAERARRFVGGS